MSPRGVRKGSGMYIRVEAEQYTLSPEEVRAMKELGPSRVAGIVRAWGLRQGSEQSMGVYQLGVSCYLQGIADAVEAHAIRNAAAKESEHPTTHPNAGESE